MSANAESERTGERTNPSYRGTIDRERSAGDGEAIEVQLVLVPPGNGGIAYGHDERGRCVAVRGERSTMLGLYRKLREAGRTPTPSKVTFVVNDQLVERIERSACPTHMLPEIPPGSAIAWAPY